MRHTETVPTPKGRHSLSGVARPEILCLRMRGNVLTPSDSRTIRESIDAFEVLIRDLCSINTELPLEAIMSDIQLIKRTLRNKNAEISGLMDAVSAASDKSLADVRGTLLYTDEVPLKGLTGAYTRVIRPFRDAYIRAKAEYVANRTGNWRDDELSVIVEVTSWRAYRQVCQFLRKLPITAKWLESEMLEGYKRNLKRIREVTKRGFNPLLIKRLRRIIFRWLKGLDLSDIRPRHGNGSVAEGRLSRTMKDFALGTDQLLDYVLGKYLKTTLARIHPFLQWDGCDIAEILELVRQSRLIFVPKNVSKLRVICAEPATLQYFQQGIMSQLYAHFKRTKFGRIFSPDDQTRNQKLAVIGSDDYRGNRAYATIDLSMASDSVSWSLVQELFKGSPLYAWLLATRSKEVLLPDGNTTELPIFAPMGSAVCFPIQSLIYAAVIESVMEDLCPAFSDRLVVDPEGYAVYGDDLVVPTGIAKYVMERLDHLGFLPNVDKTFLNGYFRESCGIEAYHGFDTTPLYFRSSGVGEHGTISPRSYQQYVDGANNAFERGYELLSAYMRKKALHGPPVVRPRGKLKKLLTTAKSPLRGASVRPMFTFNGSFGTLASYKPLNRACHTYWHDGLQRRESMYLSTTAKPQSYKTEQALLPISQMGQYSEWLSTRSGPAPLRHQANGLDDGREARRFFDRIMRDAAGQPVRRYESGLRLRFDVATECEDFLLSF